MSGLGAGTAAKGLFVVFEGLDGSGKDSILTRLLPLFYSENTGSPIFLGKSQQVARTREPTASSEDGRFLLEKLSDGSLGLEKPGDVTARYIRDRKSHSAEIRALLSLGYLVLTSRYDLSTYAYQGSMGVPLETIYQGHEYGENGCVVPDLTLFFEVPAKTALERIGKRGGKKEFFEEQKKLEAVAGEYRKAVDFLGKKSTVENPRPIIRIDGSKSLEQVVKNTEAAIGNFFKKRRAAALQKENLIWKLKTGLKTASPRILLIKQTSLGDVLHATEAIRILKNNFPGSHLTFLTDITSAGIVSGNPAIDRLVYTDFARWQKEWWRRPLGVVREIFGSLRELRKLRFDLAYDLQGLFRSVIYLLAARSPKKFVKGNWPGIQGFRNKNLHAVHEIRRVLEVSGLKTFPAGTEISVLPKDRNAVGKMLAKAPPGGKPLLVVSPFTRWPSKDWNVKCFSKLIATLEKDFRIVVSGSADDLERSKSLSAESKSQTVNLTGKLSLGEFAALMERAELLVTGDSFPLHVASALKKPVVVLFGPTDERRVGPLGTSYKILRSPRCQTCYNRRCRRRCLDDIKTEVVAKAAKSLWLQTSGGRG